MAQLPDWKRKVVLLFKSEKKLNAKAIVDNYNDKTLVEMKESIIVESMCDFKALSDKPRTNDLESHLDNLKHQFIGQSELCFYHATLIVLLRRNYQPPKTFAKFETLWTTEVDYLLSHLSLRWIVSASDTFIDHSDDATRAAILMNVPSLINTLRVYETKHFLQNPSDAEPIPLIKAKTNELYESDLNLYDGLTYFRIGTDDTLNNMRKRYEVLYNTDKLAATILLLVFDRLQSNESAFTTLRALHKDEKSKWWLDSH